MSYTTINKSSLHMNTKLYTGTGSSNAQTGIGFQPDLVWIKNRETTGNHAWFNAISGVTKYINSNSDYSEQTSAPTLTAFGTDGFTVGSSADLNGSGNDIVAWNFKANGAGSANSDGATSSTVSANTTAGFSIVKWTGTGSATTIGHGLGAVPKMIIVKNLGQNLDWRVGHTSIAWTHRLCLNSNSAENNDDSAWNDTAPTSSVFTVGSSTCTNSSGYEMIAYVFTDKVGYSTFSKYIGNNSTDGTFVYTGFKPTFILLKQVNAERDWYIYDTKRLGYNSDASASVGNTSLRAGKDHSEASSSGYYLDILSNGFKLRIANVGNNGSGDTYCYMAFGNTIVGTNNVPATGR
tara:strand:- start:83 stop:1132 length:1050 start_codon:yes stop_codon:yes gene_type:complete